MNEYRVEFLEAGYISKASYIVIDGYGRIVKSFSRKKKAIEYCDTLNHAG